MVSSSILALFAVASAASVPPTSVTLTFVDCFKEKSCQFTDYEGIWELDDIGSLHSQCGKLSYRVKPYQNVLQFFETCSKTSEQTFFMTAYQRPLFGFNFMDFYKYTNPKVPIVLPGMVYYWKRER
jgi:hypothetical protein